MVGFFAFPCPHRAGEGEHELSWAEAARREGRSAGLPGELPFPSPRAALPFQPFPERTGEPCPPPPPPALRRPLILSPLMLILEVVHRSSLICYPGGVSFRASEREPGGSARASRALREHRQPQRQQQPVPSTSGQADSRSTSQGRQIPADPAPAQGLSPSTSPPTATVPLPRATLRCHPTRPAAPAHRWGQWHSTNSSLCLSFPSWRAGLWAIGRYLWIVLL